MLALPLLFSPTAVAGESTVFQRYGLTTKKNGIVGQLQLMQDSRIPATRRDQTWGQMAEDLGRLWPQFKKDPPRKATLRIVDHEGRVVDEEELKQALADLHPVSLYGDGRISYLLTVDYSAGWGSYNGPISFFVEVAGGKIKWVEDIDEKTGHSERISVMQSLKTVWRFARSENGKSRDILEAACRPAEWTKKNDGKNDFMLIYTRYFFNGNDWVVRQRLQEGFSEFEDGFPPRRLFP